MSAKTTSDLLPFESSPLGPIGWESPDVSGVDVSVVVPCYNVETTLEQCLLAVGRNNRIALEILCIDDGSTDSTPRLLARLAQNDRRVRLFTQSNSGYGAAVNRGIDAARGRYVAIAEPDDFPAAHMYDELFDLARRYDYPDVVKSSYWRLIRERDGKERAWHNDYYRSIKPTHQPFKLTDVPWLIRYHPSIWSALYRRAFLETQGIRFMEAPGAGWVDNPFSVEVMAKAHTIVYTDHPYYHYRENLPGSSSVTLSWETRFERWHDMYDALDSAGVDDANVQKALYVVGFRHIAKALAAPLDVEAVYERAQTIFERMDLDLVASLDCVSPALRALAFCLRGKEPPPLSKWGYRRSLLKTGLHSLAHNGVAFTAQSLAQNIWRL